MKRGSSKPRVVEIFAGSGLLGEAFRQAGAQPELAIEINAVAAETIRANGHPWVEVDDVSRMTPIGRCDILLAGPPCQGFSTLNRSRSGDPRNQLALEPLRWAKSLRPSLVVVENVAPFIDSIEWLRLANGLSEIGYNVEARVLDAVDFGVPQFRRRSFTIAIRSRWADWPTPRRSRKTVAQAWIGVSERLGSDELHRERPPSDLALQRFQHIPVGGDKRDILRTAPELCPPSWSRTRNAATDVWGRLVWNQPSNTIRTTCINPSKGRYIHPVEDRVITLREAARLQSIPDDYQLRGTPYQVARQIGNSVPPKLGYAIAQCAIRQAA